MHCSSFLNETGILTVTLTEISSWVESHPPPCYFEKMGSKIRVTIESMAFRGYGVARVDGKVAFIPYSIEGEKAWVEVIEEKKDYSIGRLIDLIEPSPWRTKPFCPYFGACGGCQWQHIDYSVHGEFKRAILREVLRRIGKLREVPSVALAPSAEAFGYRVRVQLKANNKAIGYYAERSHDIVDIDHCPISHPGVNQIISVLREELRFFSGMREIEINFSPEEGKGILILHLHAFYRFHREQELFLRDFLCSHPTLKGIVVVKKGGSTLLGNPCLNFTLPLEQDGMKRSLSLRTSPGSFFQVNLKQNHRLIRTVIEFSSAGRSERVLDLYSGVGNFTLPMALEAKEVIGIEENGVAVEDARFSVGKNKIKNCGILQGKVERITKSWAKETPDLIILDPPRAGCGRILGPIINLKPAKIVYVSCDPTTFARDLRLFSEKGYLLRKLALIDMFPQSYHMEAVGLLE